MSFLAENIRVLRKQKGLTQAQFAEKIGSNRSAVGAYEEGRADPRLQTLAIMARFFGVSIDDLILTQMTTDGSRRKLPLELPIRVLPIAVDETGEATLMSLVPDKASAGYAGGFADAEFIEELPMLRLPLGELPSGKTHRAFQIEGESMLPIPTGAYVITSYVESLQHVRTGTCYVWVTQSEGVVYKRAGFLDFDQQTLELVSDNPAFDRLVMQLSDIREIWLAHGYISFDLPEAGSYTPDLAEMKSMIADLQASVKNMR